LRITRLYFSGELCCGQSVKLNENTSKHLIKVLRTPVNTPLILFNGDGFNYGCKTHDKHQKATTVHIISKQAANNESPLSITLLQGLSRQDRMSVSIQKAVELGVTKIIPIMTQYSNVKLSPEKQAKKLLSWQNVIISACEQSGRSVLPELLPIRPMSSISSISPSDASQFVLVPAAKKSFSQFEPKKEVMLLIGPEGGFSDEELKMLASNNFKAVSFGPRILRTETAGPAAISALQMLWGDFNNV
jgi:16S rRNA (uracil1498-N3)-methyltransferase